MSLETEVATLQEQAIQNKELHKKLNGNLERIWEALDDIKIQAEKNYRETQTELTRRLPLWATFLISALFSLAVGLIVYSIR